MSLASAANLTLAFGANTILEGCHFQVTEGDRVGLVGANGSGKSTLLRVIAGLERPTLGNMNRARAARIAYVSQRPEVSGGRTAYDAVMEAFAPLQALERELLDAGEKLAATNQGAALARYEELSRRFEHEGGYTYEAEARRMLQGLGVGPGEWVRPLESLSGGEQARAALAKAILQRPDLLLLDEPTNHLDLAGLAWLENVLAGWHGAFIVVSHDRFFLDQVALRIWETASGRLSHFRGNYSAYARQRAERQEREQRLYEEQQEFISRQEDLIRRYGAGQRARWAKGLEKRLDRLERRAAPPQTAAMRLDLAVGARSGRVAVSLDQVTVARPGDSAPLVRLPKHLAIERGGRVAIVGPNGCGKTTLLRTIAGELSASVGQVQIGHAIQMAFHRQGLEHLHDDATVLEELLSDGTPAIQEARELLARFLFRGDDPQKRVSALSGGERSRLALAKLASAGANLLLLDEPTNHLDIAAREALEGVLTAYTGTILFVSHDRRFIDMLATEVWLIEEGGLRPFSGNYSALLASRAAVPSAGTPSPVARRPRSSTGRAVPDLAHHEERVSELDQQLTDIRDALQSASAQQDTMEIARLGELYVKVERLLDVAITEWEDASKSGTALSEGEDGEARIPGKR